MKLLGILFCGGLIGTASMMASVVTTYSPSQPVTPAGSLPATAEDLTALMPDTIYGNLGPENQPEYQNAVNVFAINIITALDFSATTFSVSHGAPDTELFLFNALGVPVYANDDISGSNTFSCLPAAGLVNPCPSSAGGLGPVAAGVYYLAITRSSQLPWDSTSTYLFAKAVSYTDVVGPASGVAIAGWDGGALTDPNFDNSYYGIRLNGTTPEPGTILMMAGAGVAALLGRKRFLSRRSRQ